MPYNKGDFTEQGINGDVSALIRLNEKRVLKIVLSSDDDTDNCDISGKVYDLLNGTSYDIGSGGGNTFGTLLFSDTVGAVNTTSTTGINLNKDVTVPNISDYDLMIAIFTNTDEPITGYNRGTIFIHWIYGNINSRGTLGTINRCLNFIQGNNVLTSSAGSASTMGLYLGNLTITNGDLLCGCFAKYTESYTGTIDGTYNVKVYGVNFADLFI